MAKRIDVLKRAAELCVEQKLNWWDLSDDQKESFIARAKELFASEARKRAAKKRYDKNRKEWSAYYKKYNRIPANIKRRRKLAREYYKNHKAEIKATAVKWNKKNRELTNYRARVKYQQKKENNEM